jgi:hypothetical protein
MRKALVAACVLLAAACQPMYQHKADTLKDPTPRRGPNIVVVDDEPVFVETCNVNFSAPPTKRRQAPASQQLTVAGNSALQQQAPGTPRPATAHSVNAIVTAIDSYRRALLSDPYNAEATLKLALAYDRVLRKGCALAMLRRLETLAANPTLQPEAEPMIQLVVANPHWFKPYHGDALRAVGQ